jgi:O-antigen/teichoic acid export membrane protein
MARSQQAISRRIIRNTAFNSIGQMWNMAVAFLLTPYILARLGNERYGVWVLAFAITGYFEAFDFGVGAAFVKYVAESYARHELDRLSRLVSTGLVCFSLLAIIVVTALVTLSEPLLRLFNVPAGLHADAATVLLGAAVVLGLSNLASVFQGIVVGLQRMEASNVVVIVTSLVNVGGTVAALEGGYGLPGLVLVSGVVTALRATLMAGAARRLLPELRLSARSIDRSSLRTLLGYGLPVQVTTFASRINLQINRLLVAYFLGLTAVTVYEVGFKVAYTATLLLLTLVSAIAPAASELEARGDRAALGAFYLRGMRYVALIAVPVAALIFVTAPAVLRAWVGPGYDAAVSVAQVLTVSFLLNLILTGVGTTMARGMGRPGDETRYILLSLTLRVVLGLVLTALFGMSGVLAATVLAVTLSSLAFTYIFHHFLGQPWRPLVTGVLRAPMLASTLAGLVTAGAGLVLNRLGLPAGRIGGVLIVTLQATLFAPLYLGAVWRLGGMSIDDRRLLTVALWLPAARLNGPSAGSDPPG